MAVVSNNDFVTIKKSTLQDFISNFEKIKKSYEAIDHELAEQDLKKWNIKSFSNVKDLFYDLDN